MRRRRWSDDSGASSVELVFYAPLLALIVFVVVQAGLVYLGNQAATSVAREASRSARTAGGEASAADLRAAEQVGEDYARAVAGAYLTDVDVQVVAIDGGDGVRTTVEAESYALIPALGGHITRVVEGPVEEFRTDDGTR